MGARGGFGRLGVLGGAGKPPTPPVTPFSIAFGDHAEDNTTQTTYTWTGKAFAIGAADATRLVVAHIVARQTTAITLNSVTIGGVAATKIIGFNNTASDGAISELWQAAVPTGTTATVSAVFSAASLRAGCQVYSVLGSNKTLPTTGASTAAIDSTSGTATQSGTLAVPTKGGSIIVSGGAYSGLPTVTPTNWVDDLPVTNIGSTIYYLGGQDTSGIVGSRTYTLMFAQVANSAASIFAAWSP
jgi:hypothetical protein